MKIILYSTCCTFPLSLIIASIHIGLLPKNRRLELSDLESLPFLNEGRNQGRLIFVGKDERNLEIYALVGYGSKRIVLQFIKSCFALFYFKKHSYKLIDCTEQGSWLLTLSWFLYKKNFFKFFAAYIICLKIKSSYLSLMRKMDTIHLA